MTAEHGVLPEALLRRSVVAVRLVRASGGYFRYASAMRARYAPAMRPLCGGYAGRMPARAGCTLVL